jgi:hypothetical protein
VLYLGMPLGFCDSRRMPCRPRMVVCAVISETALVADYRRLLLTLQTVLRLMDAVVAAQITQGCEDPGP